MTAVISLTFACLQLAHSQDATTYTLDIAEADHGTLSASPEMGAYPEGTEITLTATPDDGYRFIEWVILRDGPGDENKRGKLFNQNPYTFTVSNDTTVRALFGGEVTPNVHYDNFAVRGDDPNGSGSALKSTLETEEEFHDYPLAIAQRFRAGDVGNVSAIELGLARLGNPGGRLIISIRQVDEASSDPGESVGTFGEIQGDSVPQIDWCNLPLKLEPHRVEGFVDGLIPGNDYFLHIVEAEGDQPQTGGSRACGASSTALVIDLVSNDGEGEIGEAPVTTYDWPPFTPTGGWGPWDVGSPLTMRFRIEGTANPESPSDPFIIATTEDGAVTKDPDMEFYPVGSEVTVTATPEDGFEFLKWTYGDEEITTNPATITIQEGATLTPSFSEVAEPQPLNLDIEHAVAVSWDSQSGKAYQIHASIDMETWEIAVDGISGTGERLMQCFLREETEVFYRVEERQ